MNLEFNVVRFTPDPEEVEAVNVALLFWGDLPRVAYDDAFPRLRCVAPDADTGLIRFYLDDLRHRLAERRTHRGEFHASLSSQFQLSAPKQLAAPLTEALLRALQAKYLQTARVVSPRPQASMLRELESGLDRLLFGELHVPPSNVMRRATPKEFLLPETYDALGGNGIVVARALRGPHHLVLIDGVNLSVRPVDKAELRAQHIAAAYFKLGKVRDALARIERRELVRATVVFGRALEQGVKPHRYTARMEYLADMLGRESDLVEDAEAPSTRFVNAVAQATPRFH